MRCLVYAYHTGKGYRVDAERLERSLIACELPYRIAEVPDLGGWIENAHQRPVLLKNVLTGLGPGSAVLSLDADCVVHSNPLPHLRSLDCDVAVHVYTPPHSKHRELLPGTLWLRHTPFTFGFLDRWIDLNRTRPAAFDRFNCMAAWADMLEMRTAELGPEFAFIFDTFRELYPRVKPVIEHFQASRRLNA